jgi:DNA-binding SARP family transcriptional activator
MNPASSPAATELAFRAANWPVLVCLLGPFGLFKNGSPVALRGGGRTEALFSTLALRHGKGVPRDVVLAEVWPEADPSLAGQALNTLVHNLHKLLGDALRGASPVQHIQGAYRLNLEAGVAVDTVCFEELAGAGDSQARTDPSSAMAAYQQAISLYRGDLHVGDAQQSLIERERLRARYLTLLARLASHYYNERDIDTCLQLALQLLEHDPCREDAHRLVMRCHVLRGERAQALRQYRLCEQILRSEFDVAPEPATLALFEKIRLDPTSISFIAQS